MLPQGEGLPISKKKHHHLKNVVTPPAWFVLPDFPRGSCASEPAARTMVVMVPPASVTNTPVQDYRDF
jgi:hypothetical protein